MSQNLLQLLARERCYVCSGDKNRTSKDVRIVLGCGHTHNFVCLREVCLSTNMNACPNKECFAGFSKNWVKEMTDRVHLVQHEPKNRKFILTSGYIKIKLSNMDQNSYNKYLHRPPLTKIELTQNIKELVEVTKVLRNRLNKAKQQITTEEEVRVAPGTSEAEEDVERLTINFQIDVSVRRSS